MGERKEWIRTIVIDPGKDPRMETIRNDLHTLQRLVGGYIEAVPLAEDMAMIVNEEGKLMDLPKNFKLPILKDTIVGTALFVGVDGEEFDDVPVTLQDLYTVMQQLWRRAK